jgi:hypothetical protein
MVPTYLQKKNSLPGRPPLKGFCINTSEFVLPSRVKTFNQSGISPNFNGIPRSITPTNGNQVISVTDQFPSFPLIPSIPLNRHGHG